MQEEDGTGEDMEEERIVGDLNSHISFTIETKEKSKFFYNTKLA